MAAIELLHVALKSFLIPVDPMLHRSPNPTCKQSGFHAVFFSHPVTRSPLPARRYPLAASRKDNHGFSGTFLT